MSLFSWKSELDALVGHRRNLGYVLPLALWGWILGLDLYDAYGGRYTIWLSWAVLIVVLTVGMSPLARLSVESTARWRGEPLEALARGRGLRWLLGLTDREPWWVTWSVVACWMSLPVTVAMFVTVLLLRGAPPREASDLANLWMGVITTAGFLVAFLLAPVVRALAGERPAASAPRRPAPEDQQA